MKIKIKPTFELNIKEIKNVKKLDSHFSLNRLPFSSLQCYGYVVAVYYNKLYLDDGTGVLLCAADENIDNLSIGSPVIITGKLDNTKSKLFINKLERSTADHEIIFIEKVKQSISDSKNKRQKAKSSPKLLRKLTSPSNLSIDQLNNEMFEIYLKNFIENFTISYPNSKLSLISLKLNPQLRLFGRLYYNKLSSQRVSSESKFAKIDRLFVHRIHSLYLKGDVLIFEKHEFDFSTIKDLPTNDDPDDPLETTYNGQFEYYKPIINEVLEDILVKAMIKLKHQSSLNIIHREIINHENFQHLSKQTIKSGLDYLLNKNYITLVNGDKYKLLLY